MICSQSDEEGVSCKVVELYVNCLEMLSRAIQLQWERIITLREKEIELNILLASLNEEIKLYSDLLFMLQRMRFDLGLDEYKGPIPARWARAHTPARQEEADPRGYPRYVGR
jgi:hypothetical protein